MTLVSETKPSRSTAPSSARRPGRRTAVRRLRADADRHLREGSWTVTTERPKASISIPTTITAKPPNWWPDPANPAAPTSAAMARSTPTASPQPGALKPCATLSFSRAAASIWTTPATPSAPRGRQYLVHQSQDAHEPQPGTRPGRPPRGYRPAAGILDGPRPGPGRSGHGVPGADRVWDLRDQAAAHRWFEEYLQWLTHSKNGIEERRSGNNHASWWAVQVAAVPTLSKTARPNGPLSTTIATASSLSRSAPMAAPRARRSAPVRSLNSAFNLEAFAMLCRMAQAQGTDLWTMRPRNGAGIGTVVR